MSSNLLALEYYLIWAKLTSPFWLPGGIIGLSYSLYTSKPLTVIKAVEGFVIGAVIEAGIAKVGVKVYYKIMDYNNRKSPFLNKK